MVVHPNRLCPTRSLHLMSFSPGPHPDCLFSLDSFFQQVCANHCFMAKTFTIYSIILNDRFSFSPLFFLLCTVLALLGVTRFFLLFSSSPPPQFDCVHFSPLFFWVRFFPLIGRFFVGAIATLQCLGAGFVSPLQMLGWALSPILPHSSIAGCSGGNSLIFRVYRILAPCSALFPLRLVPSLLAIPSFLLFGLFG